MTATPNLALTLLAAEQAQKHVTMNEALTQVDAVVQLAVLSAVVTAPPGTPTEGDRYIVPAGATGAWVGMTNLIASFSGGGWVFYVPKAGWRAWNIATAALWAYSGSAWAALSSGGGGVSDGDKGDVVVSAGGTVWSLDYTAVNAVIAPVFANVTAKPTTLAGYGIADGQPLDADLMTIAGLTATTDNFLQAKAGAWASRTVAQVKTDLGLTGTNSGDQTITLTGAVTGTGTGSFATTLAAGVVALSNMANMATGSLMYRKTAGSGAPEVQTLATLKADLGLTGTNNGDQTITLTGAVTGSGTGSFVTTLSAGVVALSNMANLAANSILGNNTGAAATPAALSSAQVKTLLAITNADVSGLGALALLSSVGTTEVTNGAINTVKLAANAATNPKMAQMPALTLKANITGALADPADVSLPLALGALHGYTEVVTAAGTTVLTNASTSFQTFTGTTTQIVQLPTATAAQPGFFFIIANRSTGALTLNANSGANAGTIQANEVWMVTCNTTSGAGVGAWQYVVLYAPGGTGSPGGSTTQMQYNLAGAFAGASDILVEDGQLRLPTASGTTAPAAGGAKLIGRTGAGRTIPAFLSQDGVVRDIQSGLGRSHPLVWSAQANSVNLSALGGVVPTAVGTATAAAIATTNRFTFQAKVEYLVTVAATTAIAGFRGINPIVSAGGPSAGLGGFDFIGVWGPATGVATTTNRAFFGLANVTSAPTDVEPSTAVNCIAMGWDAADANVQIMSNDNTGTCTKVNLGASFPVPATDRTALYQLEIHAIPGTTQNVSWRVTDLVSGAAASGTITAAADLPSTTTLLCPRGWMSVGGTSSVIGLGLVGIALDPLN